MDKITKTEVQKACEELSNALIETIELDEKQQDIKLKQAKARKRLQLARDVVHNLKLQ